MTRRLTIFALLWLSLLGLCGILQSEPIAYEETESILGFPRRNSSPAVIPHDAPPALSGVQTPDELPAAFDFGPEISLPRTFGADEFPLLPVSAVDLCRQRAFTGRAPPAAVPV